jgi:hypothetical protein
MKLKKENMAIAMIIAIMFLPNLLFGATLDIQNTKSVIEAIKVAFVGICGVTTIVLVIFTGFKLYMGQTLPELTKLLWMIAAFGSATAMGTFVEGFM